MAVLVVLIWAAAALISLIILGVLAFELRTHVRRFTTELRRAQNDLSSQIDEIAATLQRGR